METIYNCSPNLFKIMVERLPVAAIILDHNFNHIYSNPAFLNFSGLSSSQIVLRDWSLFLDSNDKESLFHLLSEINASGAFSEDKSLTIFKNKGSNNSPAVVITPMNDPTTANIYLLSFSIPAAQEYNYELTVTNAPTQELIHKKAARYSPKNVIKNKIQNQKLAKNQILRNQSGTEEYIASLKKANELKDKILAIISHDLRGPITSLKALSSSYFFEELTVAERNGFRESLLKQLDAVCDLTENLLRWATLSFLKQDSVESKALNIFEIVKQNIELVSQHALSKSIVILNKIPDGIMTRANRDQIDIVIRNLISNAIKYTPANGTVSISGVDLQTHTQICITDTGIGITKEQLSKLFTYSHSNTYGTDGEKGTGLGLLLCKEYVEFNGGKISVSSEVNTGTTIVIELPNAEISHKNYNAANSPAKIEVAKAA
ncbi:PAS domain-containing sensor histidine kinase [Dyadobacter sp. NIV53]|uniref:PAS domain-containing sensor histidine kinase n=1 Tax=Dyadobacter sp. NIV53 TaxID=2861765 RepID=UPI00210519F8|nr:PAS domain-containing sensor histidine kinase [Dyadobacter sp. NIV53]